MLAASSVGRLGATAAMAPPATATSCCPRRSPPGSTTSPPRNNRSYLMMLPLIPTGVCNTPLHSCARDGLRDRAQARQQRVRLVGINRHRIDVEAVGNRIGHTYLNRWV